MANTPKYDDAVLRVLGRGSRFRSCREILRDLDRSNPSASGPPSLSTIYRTVHRMSQEGVLDTIQSPEGERLYRRCRTPVRHYHLFCRVCGEVEEVDQVAEITEVVEKIQGMSDFDQVDHTFELTGVCPRCLSTARG
ncbi:MAG: transcriptional repressor [Nocardiopsis sp. BM-2018]|uniref:Fur family ferric uptake transcriptional regulator n=1 Tax=Nocardiopsis metallicus TaxID=179819 RepID=A0A840WCU6_9ACTN|nr:Fur family transcriptional regulator [Nocardiopsis metallicus]MBB5489825.1 Fur family ferric uptake transcriptional regulator [Nocardiopsis metallicus]QRN80415.1 MAG: transcriptional repressor [Nocardiopsis sp. BM-2018]